MTHLSWEGHQITLKGQKDVGTTWHCYLRSRWKLTLDSALEMLQQSTRFHRLQLVRLSLLLVFPPKSSVGVQAEESQSLLFIYLFIYFQLTCCQNKCCLVAGWTPKLIVDLLVSKTPHFLSLFPLSLRQVFLFSLQIFSRVSSSFPYTLSLLNFSPLFSPRRLYSVQFRFNLLYWRECWLSSDAESVE